ncbi:MAG: PorP/SprF family type IX secretion system membrane protein [Bacteroidota bacterium]
MKTKIYLNVAACTLLLLLSTLSSVKAQLNPLSSQYYLNPYLGNPAMAGTDTTLTVFVTHRKAFMNFPGSPITQNVSAAYGFKKVGLGINVNVEKAGLQRQTRAMGTFSYHLPLNAANDRLHFGLSFGMMTQSLATDEINGNPSDILVGEYNNRETYLDGDFGIAFTHNRFSVEAALPNLKNFFTKDKIKVADVPTFYSAVSYKIPLSAESTKYEIELEPKVAYRGIKGFDNIWDGGVQLAFNKRQICLTGLYHSNQSTTLGLALLVKSKYTISGLYSTQSKALSDHTSGGFEINLGIRL